MSCLTAHVNKFNLAFTVNSVEPSQNVQKEGADPVHGHLAESGISLYPCRYYPYF